MKLRVGIGGRIVELLERHLVEGEQKRERHADDADRRRAPPADVVAADAHDDDDHQSDDEADQHGGIHQLTPLRSWSGGAGSRGSTGREL